MVNESFITLKVWRTITGPESCGAAREGGVKALMGDVGLLAIMIPTPTQTRGYLSHELCSQIGPCGPKWAPWRNNSRFHSVGERADSVWCATHLKNSREVLGAI